MARHRKSSLYGRGMAGFDEFIQEKKFHIIMRSCLLALCFDSTTLFEIAVFLFRFLIFPTTSSLTGKNAGSGDEIFIPICFREFFVEYVPVSLKCVS